MSAAHPDPRTAGPGGTGPDSAGRDSARPDSARPGTARPGKVVVVGHGMVGHRFVEALLARDTAGRWRVTVLSEEPRPAYDRVALSSVFDGADEESLRLPPLDASRVDLRLGVQAESVDRALRVVATSDGERISYDQLILATGSYPFVPPVPGRDADGCFVYRTLDDLAAIKEAAINAMSIEGPVPARPAGVVIGGGLLGLEAANALRLLGLAPHIVEMAPHLMAVQVTRAAARCSAGWSPTWASRCTAAPGPRGY